LPVRVELLLFYFGFLEIFKGFFCLELAVLLLLGGEAAGDDGDLVLLALLLALALAGALAHGSL
jgi:hypothetical protein